MVSSIKHSMYKEVKLPPFVEKSPQTSESDMNLIEYTSYIPSSGLFFAEGKITIIAQSECLRGEKP